MLINGILGIIKWILTKQHSVHQHTQSPDFSLRSSVFLTFYNLWRTVLRRTMKCVKPSADILWYKSGSTKINQLHIILCIDYKIFILNVTMNYPQIMMQVVDRIRHLFKNLFSKIFTESLMNINAFKQVH